MSVSGLKQVVNMGAEISPFETSFVPQADTMWYIGAHYQLQLQAVTRVHEGVDDYRGRRAGVSQVVDEWPKSTVS